MEIKAQFPESFYKEEAKSIIVSSEKKRLWAVLLDLLLEFDRICKKHGIKYMIDGGTLLGAVRHGGFIPWDDDIDVIMLREEFEKLNKIAPTEFSAPHFWQTNETDPDHGRGYARLRNSSTTFIPSYDVIGGKRVFHHNQGVPLDVFVCDNVPDQADERTLFMRRIERLRKRSRVLRRCGHVPWSRSLLAQPLVLARKIEYLMFTALSGESFSQRLVKRLDAEVRSYNGVATENVSHLTFNADEKARNCYIFPRKFIEELTEVEFAGYKFPATKYWDKYLTGFYGNWHRHVVGANSHGSAFIDLDKPYTEYLK